MLIMMGLVAFLVSLWLCVPPGEAAEEGQGGTKEQPTPAESKKKSEAEPKAESNTQSPEDKQAKPEEPAPPKPEEQAKKPVTSPNLTIKLTLMADPSLFPYEIEVEMDNRKAVLSGAVATEEEKAKATELVKKIDGVEAVANTISVSPSLRASLAKKQDETIAQFVRDRLTRSETLKAVGFDVESENGVVHLSGKTRFQVIALEAAEAARQVPGVRAVNTDKVQIVAKD
jgi:hyperosmotically inducible protein